jgi:hypothetical protein
MDGSLRASIVFPHPGGPTNKRLWPPAAAISSARFAASCPQSGVQKGPQILVFGRTNVE